MISHKVIFCCLFFVVCTSCSSHDAGEIDRYPRMPDSYRDPDNYRETSGRNPMGMSIYDAAEKEAEEEYFGVEVVPLEESKKILAERKKKQPKNKE